MQSELRDEYARISALYDVLFRLNDLQHTDSHSLEFAQLSTRAHTLLCANPFHAFLRTPPDDIPLERFLRTPEGTIMVGNIISFGMCGSIETVRHDEPLLEHVTAIWPAIFDWIYYMCPLNHKYDFGSLDNATLKLLTTTLDRIRLNIHGVALLQASEAQRDVFLHRNHNVAQLAADIYMRGSRIQGCDKGATHAELKSFTEVVLRFAGALFGVLDMAHRHRGGSASQVLLAAHGRPRRFYSAAGRYLRMISVQDANIWDSVDMQALFIRQLTGFPALAVHRYPRIMIIGLMKMIRAWPTKPSPRGPPSFQRINDLILKFCTNDPHATACFVKHGLLDLFSFDMRLPPRELTPIVGCIARALVSRKPLKVLCGPLNAAFKNDPDPSLAELAAAAEVYDSLRDVAAKDWKRAKHCANMRCSSPASAQLRACTCSQALYCSEKMTPRDVHFLFHIVRFLVLERFDEIMDKVTPNRSARITLDIRSCVPKIGFQSSPVFAPERTQFWVDATIEYPGWPNVHEFVFHPTGGEEPHFMPLTHGYIGTTTTFDTRAFDLTGRRCMDSV
ncbi:hypothetical protein K523DRAFT_369005 [Schizophyllum commune Tattone D]|nr:hypothetical protein K523DRAFT_369005 [Schizophyllum commune Tattone D]